MRSGVGSTGGDVLINSGRGTTSGAMYLQTSDASEGSSGEIRIQSGTTTAGGSGSLMLSTGTATAGAAGDISLRVGRGDTTNADGGSIKIAAGDSSGGSGGSIFVEDRLRYGHQQWLNYNADAERRRDRSQWVHFDFNRHFQLW